MERKVDTCKETGISRTLGVSLGKGYVGMMEDQIYANLM